MFRNTLSRTPASTSSYYYTYDRTRVYTDEEGDLVFTMEVPGLSKNDISIKAIVEDRIIEISTPQKTIRRSVSENYSLHDSLATVENGLLEIKFPLRKKTEIDIEIL